MQKETSDFTIKHCPSLPSFKNTTVKFQNWTQFPLDLAPASAEVKSPQGSSDGAVTAGAGAGLLRSKSPRSQSKSMLDDAAEEAITDGAESTGDDNGVKLEVPGI